MSLNHSNGQNVVKAAYWSADSGLHANQIDSTLFTHLFCAFVSIDSTTNALTNPPSSITDFTSTVQIRNPNVKTLLSIGGGSESSASFSSMASQRWSRTIFINSSIRVARSYGFSGLDLDWEHQTTNSEMSHMTLLLDEWRAAIDAEPIIPGVTKLLLTSALAYRPSTNSIPYDVPSLNRNLDWINVMAYDFFAPNRSPVTRSHAALNDQNGQPCGSFGINAWIEARVPANKLVLGFPFYGYAWKLEDSNVHGLLAPAKGAVTSGDGAIGYAAIKAFICEQNAQSVFNDRIVSDYCYSGTTWIGYDDTQSIAGKVRYARDKGLLGYFAWHVGYDSNWELSTTASNAW